ncbi:MAG: PaaI family thioesterase [Novosphingobium sp.]|jgi:uncharacterized protein (TIGR00369 family)
MATNPAVPEGFTLAAPTNPYWEQFGDVYVDKAGLRLGFVVQPHHCNPVESLHGGALASFADMQLMALPEHTDAPEMHAPTVSLDVDFLAPARCGDWVEAQIRIDKITRRFVFLSALISARGQIIARSTILYRNNDKTGYPLT